MEKRSLIWNEDPEWVEFIIGLEPLIIKIAKKSTPDQGLQEDCAQEARIALYTTFPDAVNGYVDYQTGKISEGEWKKRLTWYCAVVIRNTIYTCLTSKKTGNLYVGRVRKMTHPKTGVVTKVYYPPLSSFDELVDEFGFDIDQDYNPVWERQADEGVDYYGGVDAS